MLLQPRHSSRSPLAPRPSYLRGIAWIAALLLVLVGAAALAHELDHQLQKPDAPCAQCLFVNHLDKAPVAVPHVVGAHPPETHAPPGALPAPRRHPIAAYAVRAPPAYSAI